MFDVQCFLLLPFLFGLGLSSASAQTREYQLKAAFLYHFVQFTEWPTNAFASSNAPLVVGVVGSDPFGRALDEVVRGESTHGHPLVVERYRRLEDIKTCHILFISQSESSRVEEIVNALRNKPVLTVSDIDQAAYRGVMVRLITEGNRIRFRINLAAVQQANLTLSSKLLRMAEIVPAAEARP